MIEQNRSLLKIFFFFFVFFYVVTLVHELGHAFSIIILYGTKNLVKIQIGFLNLFCIDNVKFCFGLVPLGGVTTHNSSSNSNKIIDHLKDALISLSGVFLSLLFSAILVWILCHRLIKRGGLKRTVKKHFKKFFNFSYFIIFSVFHDFLGFFGKKTQINEKLFFKVQKDLVLMNKTDNKLIVYSRMITYLNLINLLPIPGFDGFNFLKSLFFFFFSN